MIVRFFDRIEFFNRAIVYKKYQSLDILLKNKDGQNNGYLERNN